MHLYFTYEPIKFRAWVMGAISVIILIATMIITQTYLSRTLQVLVKSDSIGKKKKTNDNNIPTPCAS